MAGEAFSESVFDELAISDEIKRGVSKCGFEKMTPIQAKAIPVLLSGRDVIGQAQTGTGKTAAFGLPLLQLIDPSLKELQAIVLCPTRELAMQVAGEIRNFALYLHGVKLLPVYGGADIRNQIQGLKGTQIVVGTPGRVMDHMRRHTIKMENVKLCVLDEADEMLKMGFREDMEFILDAIEVPHQTCLFSATMPKEILDITDRFQHDPEYIKITPKELTIDRIDQYYYAVKREYKTEALMRLLEFHQYKKSIVFVNTKAMADELASYLKKNGYTAEALHGDLQQKQRDVVMGNFRNGDVKVLVATDIAARGIDVDDVEAVFNYDIPQETEYYVHRIGRTGRAGRNGVSHTLCKSREFNKLHDIEAICHCSMEERKIPSSNAINDSKIKSKLLEVSNIISEEGGLRYKDIVTGYCNKHDIAMEDFAAALLKLQLGELLEAADIDLPSVSKKRRGQGSNNKDGRGRKSSDSKDGRGRKTADNFDKTKGDKASGSYDRKHRDKSEGSFDRKKREGSEGSSDRKRKEGSESVSDRKRREGSEGSFDRKRRDRSNGSFDKKGSGKAEGDYNKKRGEMNGDRKPSKKNKNALPKRLNNKGEGI